MHPFITRSLLQAGSSSPIIVDEKQALDIVSEFFNISIHQLDGIIEEGLPGITLIQKSSDTQGLGIKDVRKWRDLMSEITYERKHFYLLRDFDSASLEAMNASLKSLEEPPPYALIFLIVKNPESLLETVRSRCINLFAFRNEIFFDDDIKRAIDQYSEGEKVPLIQMLYSRKIEKEEAIWMLSSLISHINDAGFLEEMEKAIISLFNVNENPRIILDKLFLGRLS